MKYYFTIEKTYRKVESLDVDLDALRGEERFSGCSDEDILLQLADEKDLYSGGAEWTLDEWSVRSIRDSKGIISDL